MLAMTSLYASITPSFTQDLLTPDLKIGYTDEGGLWDIIAPFLMMRLPLRMIEWKNIVGVKKMIPRLHIHFTLLPADMEQLSMQCFPLTPLLCFYVVKCEDMKAYKNHIKPQLKNWVESMNKHRIDYMILYVPLGCHSKCGGSGQKISIMSGNNVYKKIFDRLRVDFGSKKSGDNASGMIMSNIGSMGSDHGGGIGLRASSGTAGSNVDYCVHERVWKLDIMEGSSFVGSLNQQQGQSQWSNFIHQLRECIMEAFESKCWYFEEELRLLDAKRAQTDWEFGALLLAKERVAFMYQQTYLLDDALRHYDELEAIGTALTYDNAAHYSADDPIFRFSPLCLNLEQLQKYITDGQASSSQIELYFFCRQIRILYLRADYTELIERALVFIESFHEKLVQEQLDFKILHSYQPYHWAVGACFEIAYTCDIAWNGNGSTISSVAISECDNQKSKPEEMAQYLGELFYLARRILLRGTKKVAGAKIGFSNENIHAPYEYKSGSQEWYSCLSQMLADNQHEELEYCLWELSHLASLHFSRAGRHRFAIFLGDQCASFHLQHEEYESASRLLRSQERQCLEDKWLSLVYHCRLKICLCELRLGRLAEAITIFTNLSEIPVKANEEVSESLFNVVLGSALAKLEGPHRVFRTKMIKIGISISILTHSDAMAPHRDVAVRISFKNMCSSTIQLEHLRIYFAKFSHQSDLVDPRAITFSEYQVKLPSKSCTIVALQQAVPAGSYRFNFIKCDVARNTVFLLEASEEIDVCEFVVPSYTPNIRLEIHGPPSISPGSRTLMLIYYRNFQGYQQANFHIEASSCGSAKGARVRFMKFDYLDAAHAYLDLDEPDTDHDWSDFISYGIKLDDLKPSTCECLKLLVEAPSAIDVDSINFTAFCDLQDFGSEPPRIEKLNQCIAIPVYKSLDENIQVSHFEESTVLAIALTCNKKQGLTLRDYRLEFALQVCADRQGEQNLILHDPNTFIRDTFLRPFERLHISFILKRPQLAQTHLRGDELSLRLSYDIMSEGSDCWPIRTSIPLSAGIYMIPYLFLLQISPQSDTLHTHLEKSIYEKHQNIHFTIGITLTRIDNILSLPLPLILSLCPTSKKNWMLLGKECERITLSALNQACVVSRRLVAMKNGYIQYPRFRMYTTEESIVPDQFIYYQNLGMQVCIS